MDGLPAIRGKQEGAGTELFGFVVPLCIVLAWFVGLLARDIMIKARDNGTTFWEVSNIHGHPSSSAVQLALLL